MNKESKEQTRDYIASVIRTGILNGEFDSSTDVTQEKLAEKLGVSRMPVREALQLLVQEGFMEKLSNRHMRVIQLNPLQIQEVFSFLGSMEKQIALTVLTKAPNLQNLLDLQHQLKETTEILELIPLEKTLHKQLLISLDNKYMEQTFCKAMNGYLFYAIEHFGNLSIKSFYLDKICDSIITMNVTNLYPIFDEYYNYYSSCFETEVASRELTNQLL